jgi:hypothetical protein
MVVRFSHVAMQTGREARPLWAKSSTITLTAGERVSHARIRIPQFFPAWVDEEQRSIQPAPSTKPLRDPRSL